MSKRRGPLGSIGLILLSFSLLPTAELHSQERSVLEDVDECDTLAAHPSDVERLADGVADDAIVPRLAISACEAAAKRQPDAPRFVFQLGRAYTAGGRRNDAAVQFQKSADQGYGPALAYLGDAYQFGYGVEANTEKALDAYRKAAAKGFSPADGQIEMLTFSPGMYVNPIINDLYYNKIDQGMSEGASIQAYLFSFVIALNAECNTVLKPRAVIALYNKRYPKEWTPDADAPANISVMSALAEYDAKSFLRRHGCDGPIAARIKENLNRMYLSP